MLSTISSLKSRSGKTSLPTKAASTSALELMSIDLSENETSVTSVATSPNITTIPTSFVQSTFSKPSASTTFSQLQWSYNSLANKVTGSNPAMSRTSIHTGPSSALTASTNKPIGTKFLLTTSPKLTTLKSVLTEISKRTRKTSLPAISSPPRPNSVRTASGHSVIVTVHTERGNQTQTNVTSTRFRQTSDTQSDVAITQTMSPVATTHTTKEMTLTESSPTVTGRTGSAFDRSKTTALQPSVSTDPTTSVQQTGSGSDLSRSSMQTTFHRSSTNELHETATVDYETELTAEITTALQDKEHSNAQRSVNTAIAHTTITDLVVNKVATTTPLLSLSSHHHHRNKIH